MKMVLVLTMKQKFDENDFVIIRINLKTTKMRLIILTKIRRKIYLSMIFFSLVILKKLIKHKLKKNNVKFHRNGKINIGKKTDRGH